MLSRRDVLLTGSLVLSRAFLRCAGVGLAGAFGVGGASGVGGCAKNKTPAWPRRSKYEGVDVIELFPQQADEDSPIVVAVHGMGDKPDAWIESWSTFPGRARIVLPRGHTKYGDGYSWFELRDGLTDAELGASVGEAEDKLWKGIAKLAGDHKVIVTGFSQGGILSFAMAARHPGKVAYAFPVAGSCPGPLLPKNKARSAPLIAFHGTADPVLAFKWGEGAVNAFKEQGNDATLKSYAGVGHSLSAEMRADLWTEIQKALPLAK